MVHVTRLARVGLQARRLSTQAEFYNDRWGLERIDKFGREMFLRADGRAWGPGRHLFGNNLFSYYKDPEGNTVEYTAEVEQITDPDRPPRVMEPYPDQWRTAGSH
jgi:catechol-2,3-dioxygenase